MAKYFHIYEACRYGISCSRRNPNHLKEFAHPGDRNYRKGLVFFPSGSRPEFGTLRELFIYFDTDETGFLSQSQFKDTMDVCFQLAGATDVPTDDITSELWAKCEQSDHINFTSFITCAASVGLSLPIGLDTSDDQRICRFRLRDGGICSCPCYAPDRSGSLCECGHKSSMHRSDAAERSSAAEIFGDLAGRLNWKSGETGLVQITDEAMLAQLNELLAKTHKGTDNWTRDRGCKHHGVNMCAADCSMRHRAAVPIGYVLVTAYRNQNPELWTKYSIVKTAIAEECGSRTKEGVPEFVPVTVASVHDLDAPLNSACNEWRLFHGTSLEKCQRICASNFIVSLAGSGATWKDKGSSIGHPLYGYGVYLAEHITKADEYSERIKEGHEHAGLFPALVNRVVGGRVNVVTTDAIDKEKLKTDVFGGFYHSVLGDRVVSLKKPFREVVAYDKDQIFPEFLLIYARQF